MIGWRMLIIWASLVTLLGSAACGQVAEGQPGVVAAESATTTSESLVQSNTGVGNAEHTPLPTSNVSSQATGQTEPGAGAPAGEGPSPPAPEASRPAATMRDYRDDTYQFSVSYPSDFVLRTMPADQLAQFEPRPAAVIGFLNPVIAASDLVDSEPADLEIRTFAAQQAESLERWLSANGLLPADGTIPTQPFQTDHVAGVQLCASTMIAPGCSYFVLGKGWIYQLTPASIEGEKMINTFMLLQ